MNKVILAPAGGRKTQSIIELCRNGEKAKKRLIVTFTATGQKVIEKRLWIYNCANSSNEVVGWYSFLLKHFVYPYIYDLYPSQLVKGLHFVEGNDPTRYRSNSKRYFDDNGKVYSNNIGKLVTKIVSASNGACFERLQGIYDEIYIDEVQDLVGNDLDILELLMKTTLHITAVGDVRQSILRTSRTDTRNKKYTGLKKVLWFREMEFRGYCEIEEILTTWRCNKQVIDFADSVLPRDLKFPATESVQSTITGHDGVFVVNWDNIKLYLERFNPACYRYNKNSRVLGGTSAKNIGLCKGETVPRVLIYPTVQMKLFLEDSCNALNDQTASLFYVAITRAKYSVAIVVEKPEEYKIEEWIP